MLEIRELEADGRLIDKLFKSGEVDSPSNHIWGSHFAILRSTCGKSALICDHGDSWELVKTDDLKYLGVTPKDAGQKCMLWALNHYDLVVATGSAGTGKTTIALAWALHQVFRQGKTLVLSKPTAFVGGKSNAIAATPGTHREKLEGYIDSYLGAMRKIIGDTFEHHLYQLEEEGKLVFQPLELMRGLNFENSVVILDECQNTTPMELMTALSRVGQHSTCILMGDLAQVDIGARHTETGLWTLVESSSFQDSEVGVGVKLTGQYRGPLATLAADVLEECFSKKSDIVDLLSNHSYLSERQDSEG
jgi:predicted ribonuclease YlaK